MPKRREVPSLQSLSISSVVSLVVSVKSRIDLNEEPQRVDSELQKCITCLRELLYSHVPFDLYDEVAVEVLKAVEELIKKTDLALTTKQYKKMKMNSLPPQCLENANMIACSLSMVVLTSKLSTLKCKWSPTVNYILCHNLHRLTGLKTLILCELYLYHRTTKRTLRFQECVRNMGGSCDDNPDDYLPKCIARMKHLESVCIYGSNELLVQTVGGNCPLLQHLDLTQSSITDDCIPYLLKCQNLKELDLDFTPISTLGIAKLIAGLPKLQDIGNCEEFEGVMKDLHQHYSHCGPFGLRKVITKDMSRENLQLCASLFPKLEYVSLWIVEDGIADLTVLTPLDQLNSILLESYAFYSHHMKQLLEAKGGNITCLHLIDIYELDSDALVDLSQYCPKLIVLMLKDCEFQRDRPISYENLKVQPFQCLEKLMWEYVEEKDVSHYYIQIEFILIHAVNIHYVTVDSLTHSMIVNILAVNPMKQLEELKHIDDANMRTVELLLEKCENIKVLRTGAWWENFPDEFEDFKEYIKKNNLELSVS